MFYFHLTEAAKQCTQFRGPENKSEFNSEMLEVIRATKQRIRDKKNKSQNKQRNVLEEDQLMCLRRELEEGNDFPIMHNEEANDSE